MILRFLGFCVFIHNLFIRPCESMSRLDEYRDLITSLIVDNRMTYLQASEYMKLHYGDSRGFSESSIRSFSRANGMKSYVSDQQLTVAVSCAVEKVCFNK